MSALIQWSEEVGVKMLGIVRFIKVSDPHLLGVLSEVPIPAFFGFWSLNWPTNTLQDIVASLLCTVMNLSALGPRFLAN